MSKFNPTAVVAHHSCTFILPALTRQNVGARTWKKLPRWMREQTHGCWCSAWRLTERGWRVWRRGRWSIPRPSEIYNPKTYDDVIKQLASPRERLQRSRGQ